MLVMVLVEYFRVAWSRISSGSDKLGDYTIVRSVNDWKWNIMNGCQKRLYLEKASNEVRFP